MRFLNPTAKPVPRRVSAASVVRPEPPGRFRRSSVGGNSAAGAPAHWRMTSATGNVPVMTCPVISRSPGPRALRSRSSIGSMSKAAASLSICDSWPKQVCTAPKPRMAPHGGLLVRTASPTTWAAGTL